MSARIGVDVGGTFTDIVVYDDETGEVQVGKVPTTPSAPESGVLEGLRTTVPADVIRRAEYFVHGTTVGLNALIERRGAKVGLLATRGFRDVLEIRRGDRDEMYNLFWRKPEPLVARSLRLPVTERIRGDGQVHIALEAADVEAAVASFQAESVTAVAVSFINAYANPAHELEAEQLLRRYGFEGEISLSHQVTGEYREYERTSTTAVDAFVRSRMGDYLLRLEQGLGELGFGGTLLITRSGGGAMTFADARDRPVETILSGPVAGAQGAAELARSLGVSDAIGADVGGTSFDTCLITDGRPQLMFEGKVVGMPLQTPWVDVRSIGAGGGSIAHVDVGGLLGVGPESAGADPGPASYGRGGERPTVTDAALVLGMFGEGRLAAGIELDADRARAAFAEASERLGIDAESVARGTVTIVVAKMADAIREITVEQGRDPRQAILVPFGGAGPLFATLLARDLEIETVVIPRHAGNFSAWGLLGADLTRSATRTRLMKLSEQAVGSTGELLDELFATIESRVASTGAGEILREPAIDMRYVGQEHTLTVPVKLAADGTIAVSADDLRTHFNGDYSRIYGSALESEVEIVNIRATLRTPLPRRRDETGTGGGAQNGAGSVDAYSFTRDAWLPFTVIERDGLVPAGPVEGPMIITEPTATTYLDVGYAAEVDAAGRLIVTAG